jgi:hypothetical protein
MIMRLDMRMTTRHLAFGIEAIGAAATDSSGAKARTRRIVILR